MRTKYGPSTHATSAASVPGISCTVKAKLLRIVLTMPSVICEAMDAQCCMLGGGAKQACYVQRNHPTPSTAAHRPVLCHSHHLAHVPVDLAVGRRLPPSRRGGEGAPFMHQAQPPAPPLGHAHITTRLMSDESGATM